mmetsp:Transcript_22446/g.85094  ORF Transcript_22446/g.85094 Transcript_22446/m.85094 type:complete len:209 (+) Transcript_22446:542-1168(+)
MSSVSTRTQSPIPSRMTRISAGLRPTLALERAACSSAAVRCGSGPGAPPAASRRVCARSRKAVGPRRLRVRPRRSQTATGPPAEAVAMEPGGLGGEVACRATFTAGVQPMHSMPVPPLPSRPRTGEPGPLLAPPMLPSLPPAARRRGEPESPWEGDGTPPAPLRWSACTGADPRPAAGTALLPVGSEMAVAAVGALWISHTDHSSAAK